MNTRIVFMGSPEFSVPTLQALASHYPVVGVITQPDRPAGRGQALTPPPVKLIAQELSIPFIQPQRLRQPDAMHQLRTWQPDLIVVAAFGQILKPEVLDLPAHGCVNVHASLLPRWRGAAPIQAALLHGDTESGISIMRMDAGVDTGPIISQRPLMIQTSDTAGTLSERLARLGADLLLDTLPRYLSNEAILYPQDNTIATYAPLLKKENGQLDFTLSAGDLVRRVQAFNPWPGAFTVWDGQVFKIHRASALANAMVDQPSIPGKQMVVKGMPALGTAEGILVLEEVQPAGKKPMSGKTFLQGARNWGKDG